MSEPHRHFHDELAGLKERLLRMSGLAEHALGRALTAFLERDSDTAADVIAQDQAIDQLEIEIETTVTNLLALHQPVAKDLRLLLAALKISNDLERVGDHAVNIASSALRLRSLDAADPEPVLAEMAGECRAMLRGALDAFVHADGRSAREVCKRDDVVDDLNRSVFRTQVAHMNEDTHLIDLGLERLLVSRNLERIADLATNVAEDVVFLVEGTTIKHGAERRRD